MGFDQNIEYKLFDSLIDNNIRFAIYRLPSEREIQLVFQTSPESILFNNLLDLTNQEGFIITPFRISETKPITLIKADVKIAGEKAIFQFINNLNINGRKKADQQNNSIDSQTSYESAFNNFLHTLHAADFEKLVLSRTFKKEKSSNFSAGISFKNACDKYPNDFIYLAYTPETSTWLGCSPELLISGKESEWHTVALAGTKDQTSDAQWDEKNQIEQQIVTDYMTQQLKEYSQTITQKGPFTAQAGNLRHLKTEFTFQEKEPSKIGHLLELLHPSPAVCGFPKQEAFDFIIKNEGYDREYYSGFLGCINIENRTDLYVNLRCMKINHDSLCLFAGGGLLPSSELKSEWNETESKLQTILSIIND